MPGPFRNRCGGFTYLAALFMVVVMGIMLGAVGQSWTTLMKREREEELLFRGLQIKSAIDRWHGATASTPGRTARRPLNDLNDLLKDPQSLTTVRYLRRLYTDPITGKEWTVYRTPVWGIIGVSSTSGDKPLKQANFPYEIRAFEGKAKYSDWVFGRYSG